MSQSIGEKLRLAREERGIALRDISEQTRISIRYLEAIESSDYKRLPGGIFNRSFIRAYAKFIGYDEHSALEDYSRTLRERGETDDEGGKVHQSRVYTDDEANQSRSPLVTLILAIIILAALSLAVWAGLYFYQRGTGQSTNLAPAPVHLMSRTTLCKEAPGAHSVISKEGADDFAV
jgi:cytoskeletal protein RodZ